MPHRRLCNLRQIYIFLHVDTFKWKKRSRTFLVESDNTLGDSLADSVDLSGLTTTLDADADIDLCATVWIECLFE